MIQIPIVLKNISKTLNARGAKAILVGGSVRDYFLGIPIKDYDIEVFGVKDIRELENILSRFGDINLVGKSFGVLKLKVDNFEFDFSIPREEEKISKGHKGFIVNLKSDISFKEATERRDFTINAIGFDILSKNFLDPQDGIKDIKRGILKYIDNKKFQEDPLRVYRGVQFLARFNLKIDIKTYRLCLGMVENGMLDELPKERIFTELKKLFLKSKKPSIGINLMKELKILDKYFPELLNIELEKLDKISKYKDLKLIFATIEFYNYKQTTKFITKITDEKKITNEVSKLVKTLIKYKNKKRLNKKDMKIVSKMTNIEDFLKIAKILIGLENHRYIKKVSKKLNIYQRPLKPIITGKDLIEFGIKPSKEFKKILEILLQAQIDNKIKNTKDAFELLKRDYPQKL